MLKACMRRLPGSVGQNSPACTDLTGKKGVGSKECVTYAILSIGFSQVASASVFLPTVWLLRDSGPTYSCTANFTQ